MRFDIVGSRPRRLACRAGGALADRLAARRATRLARAEWTALDHAQSRATAPIFREVTEAALGANESFHRQLAFPLDPWLATLDSVFMLVSMGHHGVSAGDADGDGLDDLYVAQPAACPTGCSGTGATARSRT